MDETLCEANGFCESLARTFSGLATPKWCRSLTVRSRRTARSTSAPPSTSARRRRYGSSTED
ncbi:hypothetical protein I553_3101 [Mycobacterium xenopi 4042]|uniref:Uncharacterized protein n=1 Tax=Mycobacterium xenopi 4042 TaxID=1299334 RepID=X8E3L6_MYCXE|nr:hypothetical protein I552_0779 [Mycobacterium xenopi 3993]EUA75209.1 hypothetical protein I553_3101 [Mycobacterium xenopi 4042]